MTICGCTVDQIVLILEYLSTLTSKSVHKMSLEELEELLREIQKRFDR